jgi:hypothetical protein
MHMWHQFVPALSLPGGRPFRARKGPHCCVHGWTSRESYLIGSPWRLTCGTHHAGAGQRTMGPGAPAGAAGRRRAARASRGGRSRGSAAGAAGARQPNVGAGIAAHSPCRPEVIRDGRYAGTPSHPCMDHFSPSRHLSHMLLHSASPSAASKVPFHSSGGKAVCAEVLYAHTMQEAL